MKSFFIISFFSEIDKEIYFGFRFILDVNNNFAAIETFINA